MAILSGSSKKEDERRAAQDAGSSAPRSPRSAPRSSTPAPAPSAREGMEAYSRAGRVAPQSNIVQGSARVDQSIIDQIMAMGMENALELARSGNASPQFAEAVRRFYLGAGAEATQTGTANRAQSLDETIQEREISTPASSSESNPALPSASRPIAPGLPPGPNGPTEFTEREEVEGGGAPQGSLTKGTNTEFDFLAPSRAISETAGNLNPLNPGPAIVDGPIGGAIGNIAGAVGGAASGAFRDQQTPPGLSTGPVGDRPPAVGSEPQGSMPPTEDSVIQMLSGARANNSAAGELNSVGLPGGTPSSGVPAGTSANLTGQTAGKNPLIQADEAELIKLLAQILENSGGNQYSQQG